MDIRPENKEACLVGRVWVPEVAGPSLVKIDGDHVVDITNQMYPTMRDLLEQDDPVAVVRKADGPSLGSVADVTRNSLAVTHSDAGSREKQVYFLAPTDLQAIKACGVTFAISIMERVIEEKARGDAAAAEVIRQRCQDMIGDHLDQIKPGSQAAARVKQTLIEEDMWSPYLEVGIGPDAEVFTKSQPLSAVGWGHMVGLHPVSRWNNPEPEIVLAVDSQGQVKGATLGNDVNLRDVEGRSALLLGKAKDNNASCALGPFIRLFDTEFTLDTLRQAQVTLRVEGPDGFVLDGLSAMEKISRDPLDLVAQTHGAHHQYPDGFVLFLGTLFAPTQDRMGPGQGFTHKIGDTVTIHEPSLGTLYNTVGLSTACVPWTFGIMDLMRNLAHRRLL